MTYQTNPQRSGFRELSADELAAVSGGYLHEDHLPDVFQDPFPSIASMLGITSWGADGDGGGQGPIIGSDAGGNFMILFAGSGSGGGSGGGHEGSRVSWDYDHCQVARDLQIAGAAAGVFAGAVAVYGIFAGPYAPAAWATAGGIGLAGSAASGAGYLIEELGGC